MHSLEAAAVRLPRTRGWACKLRGSAGTDSEVPMASMRKVRSRDQPVQNTRQQIAEGLWSPPVRTSALCSNGSQRHSSLAQEQHYTWGILMGGMYPAFFPKPVTFLKSLKICCCSA